MLSVFSYPLSDKKKLYYHYVQTDGVFKKYKKKFPDELMAHLGSFSYPREEIARAISNLASRAGIPREYVSEKIPIILQPQTFFVMAGHQLNVALGPAFYFTKILFLISHTRTLQQRFPSFRFLPLFWLASDDHDLREIQSINLFGKKITFFPSTHEMGKPCGVFSTQPICNSFESIPEAFHLNTQEKEQIRRISEIYRTHDNLTTATAAFIYEIFQHHSPLMLDAMWPDLKKFALPLFEKEIKENIIQTELLRFYAPHNEIALPVNPQKFNFFIIDNEHRKKIRIESSDGTEQSRQETVSFSSSDELWNYVENFPQYLSPNVLMRTLYQQYILPCVAYVGGPSEINYWTQMLPVFHFLGIPFPQLVARPQVVFIPPSIEKILVRENINPQDLVTFTEDEFIKRMFYHRMNDFGVPEFIRYVEKYFDELAGKIDSIDASFKESVLAEKARLRNQVMNLEERILRLVKKRNEEKVNQIRKIYHTLFPDKMPNERHLSTLELILRDGTNSHLMHDMQHIMTQLDPNLLHILFVSLSK